MLVFDSKRFRWNEIISFKVFNDIVEAMIAGYMSVDRASLLWKFGIRSTPIKDNAEMSEVLHRFTIMEKLNEDETRSQDSGVCIFIFF